MSNICIIPARGGSKRIPGKNIKDFLGKPIIAYSIELALQSGLFDEVMVSTDNNEIAEIAKKFGAKVPFMRSEENSNDLATTYSVWEEVLLNYQHKNLEFKYACCIYPCSPLIKLPVFKNAYTKLEDNKTENIFPLVPYSSPIQRAIKFTNNKVEMFYPEFENTRSQDLETAYYDPGQFYWFNAKSFLAKRNILTDKTKIIVISDLEAQDIDNESDWKLAEMKYKLMSETGG